MTSRFASPELLDLGPPPDIASQPYETLLAATKTKLVVDMDAIGITYDVANLLTDPLVIVAESAVYRDLGRRRAIDDAVTQTYLGSAAGAWLDQRAADYGVLRRSLAHTLDAPAPASRPTNVPPSWIWDATAALWREDDTSLRLRARLAWEALSVAGPPGAYVFHALSAHPFVLDAVVYGPESGFVEPGEVLVLIQGQGATGVPTTAMLESVAARLDAYEIINAAGYSTIRPVRDEQSVRPLGARVTVKAPRAITFSVEATLFVSPGTDLAVIRTAATARLNAYLESRRRISREIPMSGLYAALHMVGPDGIPIIDEVNLAAPTADVIPAYDEIATVGPVTVNVVVR